MEPNKLNNGQQHYSRKKQQKLKKERAQATKQNPISPKIYIPLIIFGIIVVIYALWNPFNPPSLTMGGTEAKLSDFSNLDVKASVSSPYPEKSGGRKVKFTFEGATSKSPISVKDNITIISNHGVLTFKTDDKYVDLSSGKDSISGILYGVKVPVDHLAVQIFSDQQKLVKQTSLKPVTFPLEIKNLYLQGVIQKSSDSPKMEIGIYLKSNTRYEDNVLWNQYDENKKRDLSHLNASNGEIDTEFKGTSIYYDLSPDEAIQAAFYNEENAKSQVVTALHRYVDGDQIPKEYSNHWQIKFKDNKYTLIYQDASGKEMKAPLKAAKTGNFENFSQARKIPDPAPPTTTVTRPDSPDEQNVNTTTQTTDVNISQMPATEIEHRVLALLIKHWPTQLTQTQTKLFSMSRNSNGGKFDGEITYTYTTNGQVNKIIVMKYSLKNDGSINYQSTSQYSPNDFSGNIVSDISKEVLESYFGV